MGCAIVIISNQPRFSGKLVLEEIFMATHVLTSSEMEALGNFVFKLNGVQGTDPISGTGHTVDQWIQEFNDALQCVTASIFGHSYTDRPVKPPFPPQNMDGEIDPPEPPGSAMLADVAHAFVGFEIEV